MNNENTSVYIITYRRHKSTIMEIEEYPTLDEARQRVQVLENVSWTNKRTITLYKQV